MSAAPWLARFLSPKHGLVDCVTIQWQGDGQADTPSADARCRICLALAADGSIERAAFAVFGPPVAIACADWLCERVTGSSPARAADIDAGAAAVALELGASERYAALLAGDALARALHDLGT